MMFWDSFLGHSMCSEALCCMLCQRKLSSPKAVEIGQSSFTAPFCCFLRSFRAESFRSRFPSRFIICRMYEFAIFINAPGWEHGERKLVRVASASKRRLSSNRSGFFVVSVVRAKRYLPLRDSRELAAHRNDVLLFLSQDDARGDQNNATAACQTQGQVQQVPGQGQD
jgi:hypothetical protein